MKIKKAALIAFIVILISFPNAKTAENTESIESAGYEAYSFITGIGIIDPQKDIFKGNEPVTRGNFTRWAVEISGNPLESLDNIPVLFKDVPLDDKNAGFITAAYNLGFIGGGGNGNFEPNNEITSEQAVKIVTGLLGYRYLAESSGGYPSGYMTVASNLKLTKGAALNSNGILTQNSAFILLKNALETDLADMTTVGSKVEMKSERNKNLLNSRFFIYNRSGILDADMYTDLHAPDSGLAQNTISVGGKVFREAMSGASALLGQYVKIYYKDEDKDPIPPVLYAAADKNKNIILNINPRDITALRGNEIIFEQNGREVKARLSTSASLILNGKMADLSLETITPETGTVTLISNDGDTVYDVVFVYLYEIFAVKGVSSSTSSVSTKEGVLLQLDTDDSDFDIRLKKNGALARFSEISAGNILLYAESAGAGLNLKTVLVSDKFINGGLTEIGTDYVCIDNVTYSAGKAFLRDYAGKTGETGNFYFDAFDNIVYWDGKTDLVYGYLNGIKISGMGTITFRIFTENAHWVTLDLKEKIKYKGESGRKSADVVKELGSEKSEYRQLIRYLVNSNRLITDLDTAVSIPIGSDGEDYAIKEDKFRISYSGSKTYRSTPRSFDGAVFADSNAKIFSIPAQIGEITDEDGFLIASADNLTADEGYTFTAYDADELRTSSIFTLSALSKTINQNNRFMVVKSIGMMLNSENEAVQSLRGYWRGAEISFPVLLSQSSDIKSLNTLKNGDVIQFAYDGSGNIVSARLCTPESKYYIRNAVYAVYTIMTGKVKKADAAKNKAIFQYSETADAGVIISNGTTVFIYEKTSGKYTAGSIADITEGDAFTACLNYMTCREIIILR